MIASLYEHSPKLKKWCVAESTVIDHEAQDLRASDLIWNVFMDPITLEPVETWRVEPHLSVLNIPYKEFREVAFYIPAFNELPILWSTWCNLDRPVEFLVRCIEDEDVILVDTSGYHYARYRAACRLRKSKV